MLMKPPPILDDLISQDSENYTARSKDRSSKPKQGKKENTLRFGSNPPPPADKPKDYDNESVHSTGSRKSKDKRAKETTLSRPKVMGEGSQHREDDAHSVHSNGSRHSHKSTKKENTIMSRPKMEAAMPRNREERPTEIEPKFRSFKDAIAEPEESIIRVLEPSVDSPRPINYREDRFAGKPNKVQSRPEVREPKYAPFKQMESNYNSYNNYNSDEDIPVYRLEESHLNQKQNQVVGARKCDNPSESRQPNPTEQSQTIFDESRMNETKSKRRRDIFGKPKEIDNSSKVSNIEQSVSASGIDDSRRKSKSRLRQIFNNSREKKSIEESVPNPSHLSSVGNLPEFSRDLTLTSAKPVVGTKDRMVQLERKVLDDDNDKFGEESVKSGLELSTSNNHGNGYDKDRDSLIFDFEPDKKKGMSVASKGIKADPAKEQGMVSLKGNLNSVRNDGQKQEEMVKIGNNNLVSRELEGVKKILKENEEYLMKSGIMDLSASYRPKVGNNSTSSDYLFKFEEEEPIQPYRLDMSPQGDKAWHEIVPKYQPEKVNIKKVERNEKPMNKEAEEKEKEFAKKREQEERELAKRKGMEKEKERREAERQRERKEAQKERERREAEKERERRQAEKERQRRENERRELERIQREKRQKEYQLKQKQQELRRIKQETERQRELAQKQRQRQLEKQREEADRLRRQARLKQQEAKQIKLAHVPSTFSKDSDNQSERSNKSSKKQRGKKESSLPRDKNQRIQIKNLSPRAEQSFYESSVQEREEQSKLPISSVVPEEKVEKKPKLLSFSDEENDEKLKSKTDMNFYEFTNSQKSIKPPSSRPPLSRKSNTSTSKSKQKRPKQSTLGNNISKRPEKTGNFKKAEPNQPAKKMTLMERALMKHNEESSNGSYSQDSFRSREEVESQNSRDSVSSKNSRKSQKKESTIKISKEALLLQSKPPIQKKPSFDSSQEEDAYDKKEDNKFRQQLTKERTIVSKNCTFIDERGRLVQQDLIIKGGEVYGRSHLADSNVQAMQRMRRSREGRRSRSKSRQSRGKISRQNSNNISESESYYDNNSNFTNSYYDNSNYRQPAGTQYNPPNNGLALRQFMKPVEQVPNYTKRQTNERQNQERNYERRSNVYDKPAEEKPLTLNEMFARNKNQPENPSSMTQSRSRKSLSRTEKNFNRR